MKIRSKALYEHLLKANLLEGSQEDIVRAKREYRRIYKKQWKEQNKPLKEIRIIVSLKDFVEIKMRAHQYKLKHTTYSRHAILASISKKDLIPNRDQLLLILQLISISAIGSMRSSMSPWEVSEKIHEAERLLLEYLSHYS